MKILAIDFGSSKTGIAISDPLGMMAGRSFVIPEKYFPHLVEKLVETINSEKPDEVVLGFPKNMNNTEGERAILTKELKGVLEERISAPIILWDERNTTVSAHKILSTNGKKHKHHKKTVDAVAASLILEGYMMFKSFNR